MKTCEYCGKKAKSVNAVIEQNGAFLHLEACKNCLVEQLSHALGVK